MGHQLAEMPMVCSFQLFSISTLVPVSVSVQRISARNRCQSLVRCFPLKLKPGAKPAIFVSSASHGVKPSASLA